MMKSRFHAWRRRFALACSVLGVFLGMMLTSAVPAYAAGGSLAGRNFNYELNSVSVDGSTLDITGFAYYTAMEHTSGNHSYYLRVHSGSDYVGSYEDINDIWLDHTDFNWNSSPGVQNYHYQDVAFHFRVPLSDLTESGHEVFKLELHVRYDGIGDYGKDAVYIAPTSAIDTSTHRITFEGSSQVAGFVVGADTLRVRTGPSTQYSQMVLNGQPRYWGVHDSYSVGSNTMSGSAFNSQQRTTWYACRVVAGGYETGPLGVPSWRVHPGSGSPNVGYVSSNFGEYGTEDFVIRVVPKHVNVTYEPNGGDGSRVTDTVQYKGSYTVRNGLYSRTGYTFAGWNTHADGTGTSYAPGSYHSAWENTGTTTLWAQWNPNRYTLTYVKNPPKQSDTGESDITLSESSHDGYYDSGWGELATASKPGYIFDGWYTEPDGGTQVTSSTIVKGDLTVYAHWTPRTYTLTYVKNSPTSATVGDENVTLSRPSQTSKFDSSWGELATASKPGYIFDGWYTEPDGGTQVTSSTIVKGDLTVYAHWHPVEYTIRFLPNPDNGAGTVYGEMASIKVKYDVKVRLPMNQFTKTYVTPPEYEGGPVVENWSVFRGWNRNPLSLTATYADQETVMNLTANDGETIDLNAIWDDAPNFEFAEYPDRYFTLEEAQSGFITQEELLKTVKVYDRETHLIPTVPSDEIPSDGKRYVTVVGYDADEFTGLTDDSSVSVRYKVVDEVGNKAYLNALVTVTRNGALPKEEVEYYRSISTDYRDGLAEASRWRNDDLYRSKLDDALSGSARTHSLTVDADGLRRVREHVRDNGFGNSVIGDALGDLFGKLFPNE